MLLCWLLCWRCLKSKARHAATDAVRNTLYHLAPGSPLAFKAFPVENQGHRFRRRLYQGVRNVFSEVPHAEHVDRGVVDRGVVVRRGHMRRSLTGKMRGCSKDTGPDG